MHLVYHALQFARYFNTGGTTCNFQTAKILHFIVALYLKYLCAMGNDQDALNASSVSCNIVYKHICCLMWKQNHHLHTHKLNDWNNHFECGESCSYLFWCVGLCFHPNLDLGCSYLPNVAILNNIVELHMLAWENKIDLQGGCKVVGRTFDDVKY